MNLNLERENEGKSYFAHIRTGSTMQKTCVIIVITVKVKQKWRMLVDILRDHTTQEECAKTATCQSTTFKESRRSRLNLRLKTQMRESLIVRIRMKVIPIALTQMSLNIKPTRSRLKLKQSKSKISNPWTTQEHLESI